MKLEDTIMPLAIGGAIGIVANMLMSKKMISFAADADDGDNDVPDAPTHGAPTPSLLSGEGYMDETVGQKPASDGFNTSERWDFRDRLDENTNVLYNKLPFIPLSATGEFNPEHMRLIGTRDFDCVS